MQYKYEWHNHFCFQCVPCCLTEFLYGLPTNLLYACSSTSADIDCAVCVPLGVNDTGADAVTIAFCKVKVRLHIEINHARAVVISYIYSLPLAQRLPSTS